MLLTFATAHAWFSAPSLAGRRATRSSSKIFLEAPAPAGFEWAAETTEDPADVPEGMTSVEANGSCPLPPAEAYFCNENGCWIGTPPPMEPVTLPDGRTFCMDVGVQSHSAQKEADAGKRKPAPTGIFAPLVVGAANVVGRKELNALRAQVIAEHSKVISAFVDTSDSEFGQIVLKRMFEAADKDGNGTLDRQEIKDALHALGFTFVEDKQLDQIFKRADLDGNEVIDFDEFVKDTPKTLRSSLIKLAKTNGHDLGFLA